MLVYFTIFLLKSPYYPIQAAVTAIYSATLTPSTAADVMPPAYPAPSPHGYNPHTDVLTSSSFLIILTGLDVLLSTPESTASFLSKSCINLENHAHLQQPNLSHKKVIHF